MQINSPGSAATTLPALQRLTDICAGMAGAVSVVPPRGEDGDAEEETHAALS